MAFRPEWYENERRRPGGFWGMGSWSAMRIILTFTWAFWAIEALIAPGTGTFLWDVMALRAWVPSGEGEPGFNFLFPLQLVTYMLQHAPGFGHIFGNTLFLFFFGRELEASMGRVGFLRFYVTGGVVGGLAQWTYSLVTGSTVPIVGASAAVYSVLLLFTLRDPKRIIMLIIPPLPIPVVLITLMRVVSDLSGIAHGGGNVAHFAHIGGALVGVLWFKRGDFVARVVDRTKRVKRDRELKAQAGDRREMDRILAKIQAEGLGSLSKSERAYLDRRSRELRDEGR